MPPSPLGKNQNQPEAPLPNEAGMGDGDATEKVSTGEAAAGAASNATDKNESQIKNNEADDFKAKHLKN